MNALGPEFRHTVMATDGNFAAVEKIAPDVPCRTIPPPPGKGKLLYAVELSQAIRAVQPDLLITYNWGAIDAVLASRISPVCPVVHAEDGFGSDEAERLKLRRVWTRRLALGRIEALVVPSRTLMQIALAQYRIPAGKVLRIPNGVDVLRFHPGRDPECRRAWNAPDDAVLFGYAGRLGEEKNLPLMLRGFAGLKQADARLALVGEGPCRGELERLARELGIERQVIFAGPAKDTAPCYRALDVFLMSSYTEQMSIALLEAMATGLPVVTTDVGDSDEILGRPGPDCVVASGDLENYTRCLDAMYRDAAMRARLGAGNRERCVAQYSLEKMIFDYRDLYHRVAGK
jgi:glycosyltransferase involved in cell wall biosynthesis